MFTTTALAREVAEVASAFQEAGQAQPAREEEKE